MYQASVPALHRALSNLSAILDKAAAHIAQHKIEPSVLLNSRLFPDMYPLVQQVQIASDIAKAAGARLAAVEPPKFPDTDTSFDELKERIAKTVDFLKTLKPAQIDGSEEELRLTLGEITPETEAMLHELIGIEGIELPWVRLQLLVNFSPC